MNRYGSNYWFFVDAIQAVRNVTLKVIGVILYNKPLRAIDRREKGEITWRKSRGAKIAESTQTPSTCLGIQNTCRTSLSNVAGDTKDVLKTSSSVHYLSPAVKAFRRLWSSTESLDSRGKVIDINRCYRFSPTCRWTCKRLDYFFVYN